MTSGLSLTILLVCVGEAASLSAAPISRTTKHQRVFNVADYGAVGDGQTKDTLAIRRAIAGAEAAGGGTVLFPSGGRYLTGPLNLTSHCTLFIDSNATILGSRDKADWPLIPALPSYGQGKRGGSSRRMSLIHGLNLTQVTITGNNGTIDGQGDAWWYNRSKHDTPPHVIEFIASTRVELSHVTIINSPFWTVHPVYVDGFYAHHVGIYNPTDVSNTDGIDPDSTRNVLIHDCEIITGDDGIAIKSGWDEYGLAYNQPSENITIRDCTISTPCAALAIGSEMSGGVSDVKVSNCTLFNSTAGLHVKSAQGRGAYIKDVVFEELHMDNCYDAIMIDISTGPKGHPADDPTHHVNMSAFPYIHNISVRNVVGVNSINVAKLIGVQAAPLVDIHLEHLRFDRGAYICGNVSGTYKDAVPTPCSNLVPFMQQS